MGKATISKGTGGGSAAARGARGAREIAPPSTPETDKKLAELRYKIAKKNVSEDDYLVAEKEAAGRMEAALLAAPRYTGKAGVSSLIASADAAVKSLPKNKLAKPILSLHKDVQSAKNNPTAARAGLARLAVAMGADQAKLKAAGYRW